MMRDGDLPLGDPFIVTASAQGVCVIPRFLSGGDLEVLRGPYSSPECGSIVLSGGFTGFDPVRPEQELVDQTGIITRMGDPGAEFCERIVSASAGKHVEIMYLWWKWADINWPEKMASAGFDVKATHEGAGYAVADGSADGLRGVRWLEGSFYGMNPLTVAYETPGSCQYFAVLKEAVANGEDLRPLLDRDPGSDSVLDTFSTTFDGAQMVAALGGPDGNNLTLTFLSGYSEALNIVRAALPGICSALGLRLFDAGALRETDAPYGTTVDFSDFLHWVPRPSYWHEILLATA